MLFSSVFISIFSLFTSSILLPICSSIFANLSDDNLFNYQAKILRELSERESYVVIGRCADYILRDNPNVFKIFIHASSEYCIEHEMDILGVSEKEAIKNKYREKNYIKPSGGNSAV